MEVSLLLCQLLLCQQASHTNHAPTNTGDSFKLVHCVPVVPPGRLVAVQGAGLLHVPRVDPALLAAKAVAEAESSGLAAQLMQRLADAGVRVLGWGLVGGGKHWGVRCRAYRSPGH